MMSQNRWAQTTRLHEKIDLMRERELMELTGLLKAALARIETLEGREQPA